MHNLLGVLKHFIFFYIGSVLMGTAVSFSRPALLSPRAHHGYTHEMGHKHASKRSFPSYVLSYQRLRNRPSLQVARRGTVRAFQTKGNTIPLMSATCLVPNTRSLANLG